MVWIFALRAERLPSSRHGTSPILAALVGAAYGIVRLAGDALHRPSADAREAGSAFTFGSILVAIAHLLVVGPPIVFWSVAHTTLSSDEVPAPRSPHGRLRSASAIAFSASGAITR